MVQRCISVGVRSVHVNITRRKGKQRLQLFRPFQLASRRKDVHTRLPVDAVVVGATAEQEPEEAVTGAAIGDVQRRDEGTTRIRAIYRNPGVDEILNLAESSMDYGVV